MTQTVKRNNTQKGQGTPQKPRRPGQRQQERILRQQRRRRRQLIWTSIIVAAVVIVLASLSFWQYQRILAQQAAAKQTAQAHATATARAHVTATAHVEATATAKAEATPPPVSGKTVTLPDGLKYIDIKVGTGTAAKTGSTVSVQYIGWLASNGKKFDSSYDHGGQPYQVTIGQGQVIPGWEVGLVGMKPGGERRLIIPPSLAYGASGQPPTIPGNATLIFDITMVSVQ